MRGTEAAMSLDAEQVEALIDAYLAIEQDGRAGFVEAERYVDPETVHVLYVLHIVRANGGSLCPRGLRGAVMSRLRAERLVAPAKVA